MKTSFQRHVCQTSVWVLATILFVVGCSGTGEDEPETHPLEDYFGLHDREAEILCECPHEEFESVSECRRGFVAWGNSAFQLYFDLELLWFDEDGGGRECFDVLYELHKGEFDSVAACGSPHIRVYLNCVAAADCDEDQLEDCRASLFAADSLPLCYGLTSELMRIIGDERDELRECNQ